MKKIFKITIILFLVSSMLQILLTYIINEQIISRILFGVDYSTYLTNYYQGMSGFVGLISGSKMPYEWVFTVSKYIIVLVCVVLLFFITKKLSKNNSINKKEFYIIMGIFSVLTLHNVILYFTLFLAIPPINYFFIPAIFIISTFVFVYNMLVIKDRNEKV